MSAITDTYGISIDNVTAQQMEESVSDTAAYGAKEIIKPSLTELKNAAASYLNTVEILQVEVTNFENLLKRQKALRKGTATEIEVDEYINNREKVSNFLASQIPQQLYTATFNFQQIVNNFLGQQVETIFVYPDSDGLPDLYTINEEEILKYDYSSRNRLVARYQVTNKNFSSAIQKFTMEGVNKTGLANLKTTYKEAVTRYNNSKVKRVMWLNPFAPPKWHVMRVSATGDINEAYAAIVLTRQEQLFLNSDVENNLEIFMIMFVADVDNVSGLLQGDVTVGNIEYAIKSANASTLSLKQIQDLAQKLMQEDFGEEQIKELKEFYKSKGRLRNKLIDETGKVVKLNMEQWAAQMNTLPGITITLGA